MELVERMREILAREYGIRTDQELLAALEQQKGLDIGIFVSRCGRKELHNAEKIA